MNFHHHDFIFLLCLKRVGFLILSLKYIIKLKIVLFKEAKDVCKLKRRNIVEILNMILEDKTSVFLI